MKQRVIKSQHPVIKSQLYGFTIKENWVENIFYSVATAIKMNRIKGKLWLQYRVDKKFTGNSICCTFVVPDKTNVLIEPLHDFKGTRTMPSLYTDVIGALKMVQY